MSYDLVVIGGGPAGVTAALRGRELGKSVCLIERDRLGGVCTNWGCVPMRALAKAARLVRETRRGEPFGVRCGEVTVDFAQVMGCARETVEAVHGKKDLEGALARSGAELILGRGDARFASASEVGLPDGMRVAGRAFVIAVGGHARRPDFEGGEHVITPTDLWGLSSLPGRLIVLGSGATGLQAASCFRAFGSDVTVLETADRLSPGTDEAISAELQRAFERRGIRVVTGIGNAPGVPRVCKGDRGLECWIHDARHEADLILAATGWPANLEGLDLGAAGVKVEKGAIEVDEHQRTNLPHIYVAGDADGKMMLVQRAYAEGLLAADNALTGKDARSEVGVVPTGGFTDPEYGQVGLTEAAARQKFGDDILVETVRYEDLDRAAIDRMTEGLAKLIVRKSTRELIGTHLIGEEATEIVQLAAVAMTGAMTIDRLAALQFSYPTYAAILGIAARRLTRRLGLQLQWGELEPIHPEWERRG